MTDNSDTVIAPAHMRERDWLAFLETNFQEQLGLPIGCVEAQQDGKIHFHGYYKDEVYTRADVHLRYDGGGRLILRHSNCPEVRCRGLAIAQLFQLPNLWLWEVDQLKLEIVPTHETPPLL